MYYLRINMDINGIVCHKLKQDSMVKLALEQIRY